VLQQNRWLSEITAGVISLWNSAASVSLYGDVLSQRFHFPMI